MPDELKKVGIKLEADGAKEFQTTLSKTTKAINDQYQSFKKLQSKYTEATTATQKLTDQQNFLQERTALYAEKVEILKNQLAEMEASEKASTKELKNKKKQIETAEAALDKYQQELEEVTKTLNSPHFQIEEAVKRLDKELDKCSSTAQENEAEFRKIQSQYDKNTTATQKLTDQQDHLQKQTEVYSDKVDILREQLELLESDEEADTQAISKKRTELANAEAELNSYKKSLENVTRQIETHSAQLKEWGDKLKAMGDKMQDIGRNLTTHVTGPIVAAAGASVAAFKDVDTGLDAVIKKTGATGEAAKEYKAIVKDLATSIPADFEMVGNAVGEVQTRFNLTGDALTKTAEKAIKFAKVNNTDVVSSIDNVQASMAAWEIDAKNVGSVMDTVTAVGQGTGTAVDKLTSDLTSNAAVLKELGYSYSDAAWFIGNLNKNGIDASTVLSGLKKAMANATKEGKPMSAALAELQETMESAENDTEAYAAAMELFGNKAGPALAEACRSGRLSFEQLGTSIDDNLGRVSETFEATLDPIDKFKTLANEAKVTGAEVGGTLLEILSPVLDTVKEKIQGVTEWWQSLDEEHQQQIIKIAGVVAAVGPVILIIGKVVSGIGTLISAIGSISNALSLLSGPVGIVIAIIGALIAVGVLLYKNWDTIKEKASALWSAITEKFEAIKNSITEKINAAKAVVTSVFTAIKTTISNKISEAKQKVTDVLDAIKKSFTDKIGAARDFVKGAIEKIKGFFNFSWSLPKLKLPHFAITGKFSLSPPQVPKLSIQWYAKGGILNAPTVFGIDGRSGTALAGGEAGPEAVAPISTLQRYVTAAVAERDGQIAAAINDQFDKLFDILAVYFPEFTKVPVFDGDAFIRKNAPKINRELGKLHEGEKRG